MSKADAMYRMEVLLAKARTERDEARAEVERLKAEHDAVLATPLATRETP